MKARAGSICLVANELDYLVSQGGIGSYDWLVAHELAQAGWRVHMLYCGAIDDNEALRAVPRCLAEAGIDFSRLESFAPPKFFAIGNWSALLRQSAWVRQALEQLHGRHGFDLIEFADRGGLGFCPVQARRMGMGLADVALAVKLHGPSQWVREGSQQWMAGMEDIQLDYCERYAFEHADVQLSSSRNLLDYVQTRGWSVGAEAHVQSKPLPGSVAGTSSQVPDSRPRGPVESYEQILEQCRSKKARVFASEPPAGPSAAGPLVSIVVPYYNLPDYLPETLASLAAQTYPNLEVRVINDGSTDPRAIEVFEEQRLLYPQFRFLCQDNAGIGATRNRGLREANGEFFLPVDADNIATPGMVEQFVRALRRRPDVSALTCYILVFGERHHIERQDFPTATRPVGGSHVMASLQNIYGDGNAIFRVADFRAVGGYETDRDTSWEDWEAFVKLAHAGYRVDVVPEYLFYYRHLESGFSKVTNTYRNYNRVLRQYFRGNQLPLADRQALWTGLFSLYQRNRELTAESQELQRQCRHVRELEQCNRELTAHIQDWQRHCQQVQEHCQHVQERYQNLLVERGQLRYRAADKIAAKVHNIPGLRLLLRSTHRGWRWLRSRAI